VTYWHLRKVSGKAGEFQATGFNDPSGSPIYVSSYTAGSPTPPHRIAASAITASSTMGGTSTANVNDGLYLTGVWNSGGAAPAWIELDLGSSHFINSVRMTPDMSPSGSVSETIYVGNSPGPAGVGGSYSGAAATLEPISVNIGVSARYVRISTTSSPSWVAWREIEIYGY